MSAVELGVQNRRLTPCPNKPNCVSSDARPDSMHYIAPLQPADVWQDLQQILATLPRTRLIRRTATYLHLQVRSRFVGFVDDVEFHLRRKANIIAVRSASRTGWSDLGANRKRIEQIRRQLSTVRDKLQEKTFRHPGESRDPESER